MDCHLEPPGDLQLCRRRARKQISRHFGLLGMTNRHVKFKYGMGWAYDGGRALTAGANQLRIGDSCNLSGGVTASTGTFAVKRHAGAHTPVIECKMIIANQELAYAA